MVGTKIRRPSESLDRMVSAFVRMFTVPLSALDLYLRHGCNDLFKAA
jgi:hypothetical protein